MCSVHYVLTWVRAQDLAQQHRMLSILIKLEANSLESKFQVMQSQTSTSGTKPLNTHFLACHMRIHGGKLALHWLIQNTWW